VPWIADHHGVELEALGCAHLHHRNVALQGGGVVGRHPLTEPAAHGTADVGEKSAGDEDGHATLAERFQLVGGHAGGDLGEAAGALSWGSAVASTAAASAIASEGVR